MAAPAPPRIVIDGDDGRVLAVARIDLVDAVFDDPDVRIRHQVQITLPLGDFEVLDRVRERGLIAPFRAAGSTCLVEAELPALQP